jgi:hypothetical protein
MKVSLATIESEDDFSAPLENPYNPKDTFQVLVRDQMNRNPGTHNTYPGELQEKTFVIDCSKFWERSEFLRNALEEIHSSPTNLNGPRPVMFENHEPDGFEAYVRFVETENLDMPSDDDDDPLFPMLRLYVLADELGDFAFADILINDIVQVAREFNHTPSRKELWYVWQMIVEYDHPLKKLFVDYQIHEAPRESLEFDEFEHIPFDELNGVVVKYWDLAEEEGERRREGRDDVVMLYLLADKLNDTATANLVVDDMIRASEELRVTPCERDVALVYESTVAGSHLRKLCRDYYVNEVLTIDMEDIHKGRLPFRFLQGVILEFARLSGRQQGEMCRQRKMLILSTR